MSETGVVKFRCEHVTCDLEPFPEFDELNACRRKLMLLGMVGVDANGIGYGNLSVRAGATNDFYITGSGTGGRPQLSLDDYARVTAYHCGANWLRCHGRQIASSESLTHATVYEADPSVRAVIHCHHAGLWAALLNAVPTTSPHVEYGTPEMASEVARLFTSDDVKATRVFVMGGHKDGIVAFGACLSEAFDALRSARDLQSIGR